MSILSLCNLSKQVTKSINSLGFIYYIKKIIVVVVLKKRVYVHTLWKAAHFLKHDKTIKNSIMHTSFEPVSSYLEILYQEIILHTLYFIIVESGNWLYVKNRGVVITVN